MYKVRNSVLPCLNAPELNSERLISGVVVDFHTLLDFLEGVAQRLPGQKDGLNRLHARLNSGAGLMFAKDYFTMHPSSFTHTPSFKVTVHSPAFQPFLSEAALYYWRFRL